MSQFVSYINMTELVESRKDWIQYAGGIVDPIEESHSQGDGISPRSWCQTTTLRGAAVFHGWTAAFGWTRVFWMLVFGARCDGSNMAQPIVAIAYVTKNLQTISLGFPVWNAWDNGNLATVAAWSNCFFVVATISAKVHKTTLGWKNKQEHNKLHGWHYVFESRAIVTRKTIRIKCFHQTRHFDTFLRFRSGISTKEHLHICMSKVLT